MFWTHTDATQDTLSRTLLLLDTHERVTVIVDCEEFTGHYFLQLLKEILQKIIL